MGLREGKGFQKGSERGVCGRWDKGISIDKHVGTCIKCTQQQYIYIVTTHTSRLVSNAIYILC